MESAILDQVRAQAVKDAAEDTLGRQALAEPLPGPTKEALAINQDIPVGQWRVRPFYDIDYEFLSALEHPMYKTIKDAMAKAVDDMNDELPRGPMAWQLAFIMTRPHTVTEEIIKRDGLEALKDAAKAEFSTQRFAVLAALVSAVVRQMSVYWSPAIGYSEKLVDGKEREGGDTYDPFKKSSAPPLTASAGSSTNVSG